MNSVDDLVSLDTPGDPEGVKVVELFVFEKYFSWFFDGGALWQKKIVFFKLKPDVTFIILHNQKVPLPLCIATIASFSKKSTLWSHDFKTFQWKSGQCELWLLTKYFDSHNPFESLQCKFWKNVIITFLPPQPLCTVTLHHLCYWWWQINMV